MEGTGSVSEKTYRLINLLDDEAEEIRDGVRSQLAERVEELAAFLGDEGDGGRTLTSTQRRVIEGMLRERSRVQFVSGWEGWQHIHGELDRLEAGMKYLSVFLGPLRSARGELLVEALDRLAEKCRELGMDESAGRLAGYLLGGEGMYSKNEEDFYDPRNFDLLWVIENGRGNEWSLACLVVMVGRRLGIKVDGCDYPGRFMARFMEEREIFLIDACHGGGLIPGVEASELRPVGSDEVRETIARPATARVILKRGLEGLETAFLRRGEVGDAAMVRDCLQAMVVKR
ncbi:MAG: transglutaminase family protein [Verrucomicrobiota bacterium]